MHITMNVASLWCIFISLLISITSSLSAAEVAGTPRLTFTDTPKGWDVKGVPGRSKALFTSGHADGTNFVLRMTSDDASATFKSGKLQIDLNKTPLMRWRWKALVLPEGADGRIETLDDQAVGLYVSTGSMLKQKCVAYRWETDTPKGHSGRAKYGAGIVSIFWVSVRNKEDLAAGSDSDGWFIDEANVAEAFEKAYGNIPDTIGLGISCNSQFTGTKAEALVDWVEFLPAESKRSNK